ncbi:PhzF family phenazine biosynthesis protein [Micromonospora sonneratiae]|uniref:PhzF family phenazine biosynthesis protein n=1 Tax=Micromonospora sonneratiae TaxID=1184706 RepID=A0ABW3YLI2_9ACTN
MTNLDLFIVDAFTDTPFGGNPAGVVLLDSPRDDAWMQSVAAELRHSETAFVGPLVDGVRQLRWFTPVAEVDLCGHATLATTHALGVDSVFRTRSGELTCSIRDGGWIEMDFPADPAELVEPSQDIIDGVGGASVVAVGRGVSDTLVQVASAAEVRALRPDLAALARVPGRGVIVTASADGSPDVVSRCFYPNVGVPEDPVTGSAHCTLASWWAPRLGRDELWAEQASPRGGSLRITLRNNRVTLAGQAVTVVRGTLTS